MAYTMPNRYNNGFRIRISLFSIACANNQDRYPNKSKNFYKLFISIINFLPT